MVRNALFFLFVFITVAVFGQHTKHLIDQGDHAFGKNDFNTALKHYKDAEKIDPNDAKIQLRIGVTLLSTNYKFDALPYLEKAYRANTNISQEINYYMGCALQARSEFDRALEHFQIFRQKDKKFAALADNQIEQCKFGLTQKGKNPNIKVEALKAPVNSKYNDFAPLIDSEETTLIFSTARDSTKRDVKDNNRIFESIMFSEQIAGNWTEPKYLSQELNHEGHDAATYLSGDGKSLVVYYGHEQDLFISKYVTGYRTEVMNGVWTKAEPIGAPINSVAWESSGCFSPDGQYFFFSSDRPGGYGELDIYMSKMGLDGKWERPINLGPEVNTPANEDAPFMHPDGTLYFGSEGLKGMGGYDIFKTRFKNEKWQKPENLGPPVNSPDYDNYFMLMPDKHHGYFTSVRSGGVGNTDIFMATFPVETEIDPVTLAIKMRADSIHMADSLARLTAKIKVPDSVLAKNAAKVDSLLSTSYVDPSIKAEFSVATEFKGRVIDEVDGKPLAAQIVLIDNKTNKVLTRANTSAKTGIFIIIIPHGGNFGVSTNCDGYLFNSMNFDVPAFAESQTIETAIMMRRAEVGNKSVLKNIFFDSGKSDIKKESYGELENIIILLTRNPKLRVQINGHTDSFGDNNTNKVLSLKRAQSVVDYLIMKGVDQNRVKAVGYGEERPLVSNDDEEEGREINRRTEIEVVEVSKN